MTSVLDYHQIKTLINFWYRRELNSRSLIQPLKTLPVKLIETHLFYNICLYDMIGSLKIGKVNNNNALLNYSSIIIPSSSFSFLFSLKSCL